MITYAAAILIVWAVGTIVMLVNLSLMENEFNFKYTDEVVFAVILSAFWPIVVPLMIVYRFAALFVLIAALLSPTLAIAQADHRGEAVTESTTYRGVHASAPIPPELHIRNEGGSDGAGLCVISSVLVNGMYQKVPALAGGKESLLWRTAKRRPGGYFPDKLANIVAETVPGEKYASYTGTGSAKDLELLEKFSKAGYPIGATMNTGQLYKYQPIHHMISLIHYRRNGWACVVDNNRPGFYSWMPSNEWERRWPDMGTAWLWVWTRLPSKAAVAAGSFTLILVAVAIVVAGEVQRQTDETNQEFNV